MGVMQIAFSLQNATFDLRKKKEAARRNPAASDLLEYTRINVYLLRRAAANAIASAPKIAAQVDGSGTAVLNPPTATNDGVFIPHSPLSEDVISKFKNFTSPVNASKLTYCQSLTMSVFPSR